MKAKPVIPYPEVESEFIRQAIKDGSFDDREYRTYVNELIHIERFVKKDG